MAALSVRNVVKSYGRLRALDDVSFSLEPGAFVALLGPNGAGKSTLFQLLCGLSVADAGTILVADHDVARQAPKALARLGIVFQQPTLDLELSVTANLRFHAALHGMSGPEAKGLIATQLDRFGLTDRARDAAGTLSGGNRRRVELARALLHAPPILLMDEPTVGLDPASRRDLKRFVMELARTRGTAVLWATHLCDEADDADRVLILHRGKLLRDTTPRDLVAGNGQSLETLFLALTRDDKQGGGKPA